VWAALVSSAATLAAPLKCQAQYPENLQSFTVDVGGGFAPVTGSDAHNLVAGWVLQAGVGFRVTPKPKWNDKHDPSTIRRWNLFLTANFISERSGIRSAALQQAITMNPQNTALLSATSASAKFYGLTIEPTLERGTDYGCFYFFGGFGWLRRTIDFTGGSNQGALLQPSSPSVFGQGGNSGVFDGGAGIAFAPWSQGRGLSVFVEARVLRGLANNSGTSGTTLLPFTLGLRWGR
jgi:hypothetical protein